MPSTETAPAEYPIEVVVGIVILGITAGVFAGDAIVGLGVVLLATIAYLLFRILRTLELIAANLSAVRRERLDSPPESNGTDTADDSDPEAGE
jgi:hypothetical protein